MLVVLGYAAFILAGYNPFGLPFVKGNEALALPLYFYFALALLTFEVAIAQPGTVGLQIYLTLTSAFTLGFVANTVYFGASNDLAHNPTTYLVINVAALFVFIYGLVTQQMTASGRTAPGDATAPGGYSRVATALTGLALLGFLFWGLLAFVEEQLGVRVPISGLESIGVTTLGDLDRDIGLGALFLALVVMVIVGLFSGGQAFLTTLPEHSRLCGGRERVCAPLCAQPVHLDRAGGQSGGLLAPGDTDARERERQYHRPGMGTLQSV